MTITEHQEYLASEWWLQRRKAFLARHDHCCRCRMPREVAREWYDQDLNVHHRNYQRKGAELDSDLEALCHRCHEIESKGASELVPYIVPLEPVACEPFLASADGGHTSFRLRCPWCGVGPVIHFQEAHTSPEPFTTEPEVSLVYWCENGHFFDITFNFGSGENWMVPANYRADSPDSEATDLIRSIPGATKLLGEA